jgi:Fungal hydrophobin
MHLSIIPLVAAIFASAIVAAPANNLHLRDAAPIPTSCDANTQAACCDTVADPDDPAVQTLIGALGLLIPGGLIGQVGLTCTFTATVHEAYFHYIIQLHRHITLIHHIYH